MESRNRERLASILAGLNVTRVGAGNAVRRRRPVGPHSRRDFRPRPRRRDRVDVAVVVVGPGQLGALGGARRRWGRRRPELPPARPNGGLFARLRFLDLDLLKPGLHFFFFAVASAVRSELATGATSNPTARATMARIAAPDPLVISNLLIVARPVGARRVQITLLRPGRNEPGSRPQNENGRLSPAAPACSTSVRLSLRGIGTRRPPTPWDRTDLPRCSRSSPCWSWSGPELGPE